MIKLHLDFGTEIELAWTAKANNSHLQVFMFAESLHLLLHCILPQCSYTHFSKWAVM